MIERGSCVPSSRPRRVDSEPGGDVAHDDLERDDLDLADQLLAHVEAADEMRRDADLVEMLEDVLGDAVVEHALAVDDLVLLGVEGGGVVLEVLDQRAGLGTLVEDLRLAFIDATAAVHRRIPWFEEIHGRGSWEMSRSAAGAARPMPDRPASRRNLSDRLGKHNAATARRCDVKRSTERRTRPFQGARLWRPTARASISRRGHSSTPSQGGHGP